MNYRDDYASAKKDNFIAFFSICIPFISFFHLIALAGTSGTILKSCGRRECSCFVSGPSVKISSFSPLNMRLVIESLYLVEEVPLLFLVY